MTTEAQTTTVDEQKPVVPVVDTPLPTPVVADPAKVVEPPAGEPEVVAYEPTGDVGLDMALEFVGRHGFHPDHPALQAAVKGDFSILSAKLAEKGAVGYERFVALAEKAYGENKTKAEAKASAELANVHKVVGGAEQWTAISEWAKKEATPEEAKEFSAMLAAGGFQAKAAAKYLAEQYARATGQAETQGAGPAVSSVQGTSAAPGTLDAKAYGRAVQEARSAFRGRGAFEESPEYRSLQARRTAHR